MRNKANGPHTPETLDWKNKPDIGAGVSHFLWAEEREEHNKTVKISTDKFNSARKRAELEEEWKFQIRRLLKNSKY